MNRGATHLLVCLLSVLGMLAFAQVSSAGVKPLSVRAQATIQGPKDDPFNMPTDVVVGRAGQLYILDGVHHRVVVFDGQGTLLYRFGSQGEDLGQLHFPVGITAAQNGQIYVADSGNHRIQIFSELGKALSIIPLPTQQGEPAPDPTDMVLNPEQTRLYIADNDNHRLLVYNLLDRRFEASWGSAGQGRRQFRYPFLLDTSPEGYLFVVEPINTRVQVLNAQGKFVGFVGNWGIKAGQLFRPKGVVTYGDTVFVTDSYLGHVQRFTLTGEFLGRLTNTQGQPIKLVTPTGISIDAQQKCLYVVELKANRVCRLDLE